MCTHDSHAFEHVPDSLSLLSVWQNSGEVADLVVGHFPSKGPTETRRGVVGRSKVSATDCVVDVDDGCTIPTGFTNTYCLQNIKWRNLTQSNI